MQYVLTDSRHVFHLPKKIYMPLGFVEQILGLIIGIGEQYLKGNPRVAAERLNGASTGMD
jgi:hypothetical protein